MTTTSANQALTLPTDFDLNDVATSLAAYNTGVESRLVQRYLTATDRAARNPSPPEGALSYIAAEDRYDWFTGSVWETIFSPGPWTPWVPTWGAVTGTQPVLGNGSIAGRYQRIGKTVHFVITLLMGSTSTYPTIQWYITLPFPAMVSVPALIPVFHGRIFDNSVGTAFLATAHAQNPAYMALETQSSVSPAAGTDVMRQGFPITWATGDAIYFSGTYEAA